MRAAAAIILVLLTGACASTNNASLQQPEIRLYQLGGSTMALQYAGRLSLGFAVEVTNTSGEPLTLRQITLRTVGGGPYALSSSPIFMKRTFGPGESGVVEFSADALSYGHRTGAAEPVMIRGIARFESPAGPVNAIFTQMLDRGRGAF